MNKILKESPDETGLGLTHSMDDARPFFFCNKFRIWSDSTNATHAELLVNLHNKRPIINKLLSDPKVDITLPLRKIHIKGNLTGYKDFLNSHSLIRSEFVKAGAKQNSTILSGRIWLDNNVVSFWNSFYTIKLVDLSILKKSLEETFGINVNNFLFEFPGGDGDEYESDFTWQELLTEVSASTGEHKTPAPMSDKLHTLSPELKGDAMKAQGIKPKTPLGAEYRYAMGESFKVFFEAHQSFIDQIQDAIDKVSDRPFNELFENKGERFLIKVHNPNFEKNVKDLGLNIEDFDWTKRTYKNHNINTFIKKLKQPEVLLNQYLKYDGGGWEPDDYDSMLNDLNKNYKQTIQSDHILYKIYKSIAGVKQAIDQKNIFYYLLFSRHPVDVLRMSDHKGISSCHRLGGGKYSSDEGPYQDCALADAKNDGGIVYLIKGSDARKVNSQLNEKDVFHDKDRDTGTIQPIGRIRLRRFIDIKTGKDFAVPTTLQDEQKYGYITKEIYDVILNYVRKHQSIYKNPPESEYARENIVLVGGTYSDEELSHLLNNFFGKNVYNNITHKEGSLTGWDEEIRGILENITPSLKPQINFNAQVIRQRFGDLVIVVRLSTHLSLPYNQTWNIDHLDNIISEDIDANRLVVNNLLSFKARMPMRVVTQQSTWNKNILTSEITFNIEDPQDLYPILESLIKKKKAWNSLEQIILSIVQYKMEALAEN